MKKYLIAPSVLSANFMKLQQELELCKKNNIEWIHYDVMDFDFVPNLTFGSKILHDIKKNIDIKVDVHFMIKVKTKRFEDFFKDYIAAKPEMMTMHVESLENKTTINQFIEMCKKHNILASLAVRPKTSLETIKEYLYQLDNVLVMSVEPGFGGQEFIDSSLDKIKTLFKWRQENNYKYSIEVDGGINKQTSELVKKAGVDMIVAGSYLFGSDDFESRVQGLFDEV
ncbi:ribulose-phosphate 3-epimerase [Mycoplasma putrefaciens]|uniref:Ribulose-phosphate 3-epimerase n=2 Tax=Mycoplasma putrefaciens TaxID=2123 RepID=M9WHJ4_9MOLU|nr:ribulose-phosphate 3-epimerase [Mycoplasma putrefaciens]AEM68609.1 ribulose-phosphate 3 epimerase [Mycoplasma putrefaciens KS1]AGJ90930.1 Ribulose-phosphate 3-epimerase [Mycoplasma putrefaciens Mput9231]